MFLKPCAMIKIGVDWRDIRLFARLYVTIARKGRSAYHFPCLLIAVFCGMFCGVWVQPSVLDELMFGLDWRKISE